MGSTGSASAAAGLAREAEAATPGAAAAPEATQRAAASRAGPGAAPPPPWIAGLTRLRLLFIGWVVLYHLELALHATGGVPVIGPVLLKGYLGVDGFFVLSGFALWLGYRARPPRGAAGCTDFLARRMARIMPLHLAALLGLAVLVGAASAAGVAINDPERFSARDFALQLVLINAWETTDRLAWNYPSWALSAIWAGYLAFPLLLRATLRVPGALLGGLAALLLPGLLLLGGRDPSVGLNLTVHLGLARFFPEFALGLVLGRLSTEGRIPAGLALAVAAVAVALGLALRVDAVVVAGLAALVAGIHRREAAHPGGAGEPRDLLHRLGAASFGIYMCWVFVEAGLVLVLRIADPGEAERLALMLLAFLANLGAGWLAWRLIEVPANRWVLARLAR